MSKQYRIDELIHYGIKGQKWGVRRFQNKDGSLTLKGKKRYSDATWDGPLPTIGEVAKMKTENPAKYSQYQAYRKAKGYDKQAKQQSKDAQKSVKNAGKEERMKKNTENLGKTLDTAKNAYDKFAPSLRDKARAEATKEARAKISYDLSQMSDNELKQVVNRLNMEERYTQVMMGRHAESGKSFTEKLIDGAGTALVLGTSALALAEQMKKLKAK